MRLILISDLLENTTSNPRGFTQRYTPQAMGIPLSIYGIHIELNLRGSNKTLELKPLGLTFNFCLISWARKKLNRDD